MKVYEAIAQVQALKPSQYDIETMTRWLSNIDGLIYEEIIKWHEGTEDIDHGPYDPVEDSDTELMVPDPYSDLYVKYLMTRVDFYNAEMGRYNQSSLMFNTALSAFGDWYNRSHTPKQDNIVRI